MKVYLDQTPIVYPTIVLAHFELRSSSHLHNLPMDHQDIVRHQYTSKRTRAVEAIHIGCEPEGGQHLHSNWPVK